MESCDKSKTTMAQTENNFLFNTRYRNLAKNTFDYWMTSYDHNLSRELLLEEISRTKPISESSIQIYIHVPFCANSCSFCAFSGGNHRDTRLADRYSKLLIKQLDGLMVGLKHKNVESINIGGGSPDLIGDNISEILQYVTSLPGYCDDTELSVEVSLNTVKRDFIEKLIKHHTTKLSFGIQTFDAEVRKNVNLFQNIDKHFERVLEIVGNGIPVINADLLTGLPGQSESIVQRDIEKLIENGQMNSISSYLLTLGAAPSIVADIKSKKVPKPASQASQARMRLNTYVTLFKAGWIRKGAETYMDPSRIADSILKKIRGNECIGGSSEKDFLIGAGPQAISYFPGIRLENTVDLETWSQEVEQYGQSFFLQNCSLKKQNDIALWVFPLRYNGLKKSTYEELIKTQRISKNQIKTFESLIKEGLIQETKDKYELTILGDIFKGQIVRDFKNSEAVRAIDDYISEGLIIGGSIAKGDLKDSYRLNNRQTDC